MFEIIALGKKIYLAENEEEREALTELLLEKIRLLGHDILESEWGVQEILEEVTSY